jgi:predicted dithiol-disulfide oxidoreductase (DUF899 family)
MTPNLPEIVSREAWVAARKELLEKEKRLTRERDALNADRRRLPMVEIDKPYVFHGPEGALTLADLFERRSQLVVYHFMWLYDRDMPCPSCSAFADQIGHLSHLNVRDTTFACVSNGPIERLEAFKARMGWSFPWYSSQGSDFNYDFHVTFDESRVPFEYNYRSKEEIEATGLPVGEWEQPFDLHGLSAFLRADDRVFHTYSTYARGTDHIGFIGPIIDLTALGRQEDWEEPKGRATAFGAKAGSAGIRYHDEYDEQALHPRG